MKPVFQLCIAAIVLLSSSCNESVKEIEWISSSPDAIWQISRIKTSNQDRSDSAIQIFPDKQQQIIDGFGGCFNELGWEALNTLPEAERGKIVAALFDTESGCKFNLCRMPIGANDYSIDWYSHSPAKDDFSMQNFTIERDKLRLIPYIKKAKAFNPDIKIWASPWCPNLSPVPKLYLPIFIVEFISCFYFLNC